MGTNNKTKASSDMLTAIVALATGIVVASTVYVAYTCCAYYGTISKVVQTTRF